MRCVLFKVDRPPPPDKLSRLKELIEPWFVFSLVWSVGATGDAAGRQRFSAWLRDKMTTEKVRPSIGYMARYGSSHALVPGERKYIIP